MRARLPTLLVIAAVVLSGARPSWVGAAETPPPPQSRPYDADLLRLAELLGALQFLRGICNGNEGQKWREQMQALIDAEAPNGERRDRLTASFNRGYRGFQQSYRVCTPAAELAIRRFLDEGTRITHDLTARYSD
jgi:uncharacterized protein (TIGR02301 family)